MSRSWSKGSTRAWRTLRARVLARDQYLCRLSLDGCTIKATHVHHLLGKAAGDNADHLVAACKSCNYAVGEPSRHNPEPRPITNW